MSKTDFDDDDLEFDHQSMSGVQYAVGVALREHNVFDEIQLSSDLDSVRLYDPQDGDGHAQPKREDRDECMFGSGRDNGGSQQIPAGGGPFMPHAEMPPGHIDQPSSYPWSQPHSVETDNVPSMMSAVLPPPQCTYKPSTAGIKPGVMSPDSMQYGGYDMGVVDSKENMQYSQPGSFSQSGDFSVEASGGNQEGLSYQLDEIGECPLHTLSLVTDKTVMANVLKSMQNHPNFPVLLNLQNKLKQTPLFLAIQAFNVPLIGWLLQHGADPYIQGTINTGRYEYVWRSPLHLVCMMGDSAVVILEMMRSKYLDLNMNLLSIGDKLTPLHIALRNHSPPQKSCKRLITELIKYGADVGIREQASSKTPLIMVIETRDLDLIREYLELFTADRRRALLQDKTRSGDTCLHIAAGLSRFPSQHKEVLLRMLVMHGANGNTTNNAKELPRDFARTEWDRIRS